MLKLHLLAVLAVLLSTFSTYIFTTAHQHKHSGWKGYWGSATDTNGDTDVKVFFAIGGFGVSTKSPPLNGGNFQFSADALQYTIVSPGHPSATYPNPTDSTWTFQVPDFYEVEAVVTDEGFRGAASADCSSSDRMDITTQNASAPINFVCDGRKKVVLPLGTQNFGMHLQSNPNFLEPPTTPNVSNGFNITLKARPGFDLQCHPHGFTVKFPFAKLENRERYPYENYQLLSSGCKAAINATFLTLHSEYGNCGTTSTSVTYANAVLILGTGNLPPRRLPISCDKKGTIDGVIKDALLGTVIPSVTVTATAESGVPTELSSSNGTFDMVLTGNTSYNIDIAAPGYYTAAMANITVEPHESTVIETLHLISKNNTGPGVVSGIVTNAFVGTPEDSVKLSFRDRLHTQSGPVLHEIFTDHDGHWSTTLETGYYTAEMSKYGFAVDYITITSVGNRTTDNQNAAISPVVGDGKTRVVLTWGTYPEDLDAFMTGPDGDSRFTVFYKPTSRGSPDHPPWTNLDVDKRQAYGPETITINKQANGVYRYTVQDYGHFDDQNFASMALADSGAQVHVFRGKKVVQKYNVPHLPGTMWTVFELQGDVFTPINEIHNDESKM